MPLITILSAISSFLPEALAGYFLGKGMDKMLEPGISLKDDLQDVIQETIVEYSDADPRDYGRKLPFYHSVSILEGLLKFRVMAPEDYDPGLLLTTFENEEDIVPPTADELNSFLALFMAKISSSDNLRKLEIKETYSQEIFTISRKITDLSNRIDNLALQYTGDLELQWKDRVDTYVKTLKDFKPATALGLLESLERSLQSSSKRPGQNFMAFLEFQKGECLGFLGRRDDLYRAKLKAWTMDSGNTLYGQSASICLYRMKDAAQLANVLEAVFILDAFNPVAWAIKTLERAQQEDLKEVLNAVPVLVYNDQIFRRVMFNEANYHQQNILFEEGLVLSCLDYQEKEVTIDKYGEAVFWVNSAVKSIFRVYFLDYYENNQAHREEMLQLNKMLKRFLEKALNSEITDNFELMEYLLAFTEFSIHDGKDNAQAMETIYRRMLHKELTSAIQTANALQLSGLVERGIALLENEPELTPAALLLLLHSYQKIDDMNGYCRASKKFAASITLFDNEFLLMYLNLMVEIRLNGQIGNFSKEDFVSGKTYVEETDVELVNAVADLIFDEATDETRTFLVEMAMNSQDSKLVDILGSAFFAAEAYESALSILARNLDGKSAGRELYQYIHAKNKTGQDYPGLLKLLESWRLNSPFSAQFCRLEAQLRQDLVDWKSIVDICEYYLEHLPDDSAMLALFANSLHLQNDEAYNKKLETLPWRAKISDFHRPQHLIAVVDILFLHGMYVEAFELLYPKALDPAAIELRATYAKLVLHRDDTINVFMEYETVEPGHFVKFEREGQVSYIELTDKAMAHPVYKMFPGRSKDETVSAKRPLTNLTDTYKITRIMNKYLALFDQIMDQSEKDPHAGLPFSVMKIDPENPGSIFETMQSMFGDRHQVAEKTKEANFDSYYNGTLSLSELISTEYDGKFLQGYYNVIRFRSGISSIRRQEFAKYPIDPARQMVLDYTSAILFYQVWNFHKHVFSNRFIVSKYLVEQVRFEISTLQYKDDRFNTSGSEIGKVAIEDPTFAFLDDRMAYLQGLLEWILSNCEVQLSEQTLDAVKQTGIRLGKTPIMDIALGTLLLITDDPNRLLVTDDSFYLRMGLMPLDRIVSSEHYLKSMLPAGSATFNELVRNRFNRYSPTSQQLSEEYVKYLSGSYSNYALLLSNLSVFNSAENLETGVAHLKQIALKPMLTDAQILRDMTAVFVNLLKGFKTSFIDLYTQKIFLDFRLMGLKQDIAMQAIYDARNILLA
ncbi:hypothetical protein [Mucilaginibacter sp.]|uniref:PIN domain-containing protein n=1 Tax=Mucilaginibacter sp. TaxID=1882438 RepID=UPI0035BC3DB6